MLWYSSLSLILEPSACGFLVVLTSSCESIWSQHGTSTGDNGVFLFLCSFSETPLVCSLDKVCDYWNCWHETGVRQQLLNFCWVIEEHEWLRSHQNIPRKQSLVQGFPNYGPWTTCSQPRTFIRLAGCFCLSCLAANSSQDCSIHLLYMKIFP